EEIPMSRSPLLSVLTVLILGCGTEAPGPAGTPPEAPPSPPPAWSSAVGEYAQGPDTVSLLEDGGELNLFFWAPGEREGGEWAGERRTLTAVTDSSFSLAGTEETAVLGREEGGRVRSLVLGGRELPRIFLGGEAGGTFRITPVRPPDSLRVEALAAIPPEEEGDFLPSDLVELTTLDSTLALDIRYATTNNFMGEIFYSSPRAFLQRPAAEALARAHAWLRDRGYGLLIHDGYRPWYVTRMFWDATPEALKLFVADPASGSRHNRGCAVDLTLVELATGEVVTMPGGYDEMSPRSYITYPGGTSRQRWLRELLREAMEAHGFTVYPAEWWHFDYQDWRRYRIGNQTFEEIGEG
ncbi:MAG: M15 family metallopeptidase, partial [Longimicrobiales bacterium]